MTYVVTIKQLNANRKVWRSFVSHYQSSDWSRDEILDKIARGFNMDATRVEIEVHP